MAALSVLDTIGLLVMTATVVAAIALPWPKAYTLALGILVTFALQLIAQGQGDRLGLDGLTLVPQAVISDGAWYTVLTYAFLHQGAVHLIGNLFILLTAGPVLEDSAGPWWFLGIYTAGALAASGTGMVLAFGTDLVSPFSPMLGASGAIFGILTAFAVRHPREQLPMILIYFVVWFPAMGVLGIYLAYNVVYMIQDLMGGAGGIAWYGHFAGFIAGLALAGRAGSVDPRGLRATAAASRTRGVHGYDASALAPFGVDDRRRKALGELRRVKPGEEDVARAWLESLAQGGRCPTCGLDVSRTGLALVCGDGHRFGLEPVKPK